jgi:thiol-disulfide isomerase/thioredoxin
MDDESPDPTADPVRAGGQGFGSVLLIVAVAAIVLAVAIRFAIPPENVKGQRAPEIYADGWLNGSGPTPEDLHGKVIVLDAWAYWCGPCRAEAPKLVKLHEKYREQGVVFLGLTGETLEADADNRRFLQTTRITWPNGYGAMKTLAELKADTIPQYWVIDRNYKIIWTITSKEPIEAAIDRALAQSP